MMECMGTRKHAQVSRRFASFLRRRISICSACTNQPWEFRRFWVRGPSQTLTRCGRRPAPAVADPPPVRDHLTRFEGHSDAGSPAVEARFAARRSSNGSTGAASSERRGCAALGVDRSTIRYRARLPHLTSAEVAVIDDERRVLTGSVTQYLPDGLAQAPNGLGDLV